MKYVYTQEKIMIKQYLKYKYILCKFTPILKYKTNIIF